MSTQLAVVQESGFTQSQIDIIKSQVAPTGTTNDELAMFLAYAQRTGLDPISRQIYLSERRANVNGQWVVTRRPETTIDGFRLIAERTGHYAGQLGPFWCGPDGEWKDVWLEDAPPSAAKVGILRDDFKEPLWGVALYREYVQTTKEGQPNSMWKKMGANQLAKCAESQGHRRAFPREMSGLYTREEMGQAERVEHDPGSAEAQLNVARERVAALGGNPEVVQQKPPKAPRKSKLDEKRDIPKPDAEKLRLITAFQDMKKALHAYDATDATYYGLLEAHGAKHCDEFDTETARLVFRKLKDALLSLKTSAANRAEIQDIRDAIGHEVFWKALEPLGITDDDTLDATANDGLLRILDVIRAIPYTQPEPQPALGITDDDVPLGIGGPRLTEWYKAVAKCREQLVSSHRAGGRFNELLGLEGYERIEDVPNMEAARRVIAACEIWAKDNPPANKPVVITPKGAA